MGKIGVRISVAVLALSLLPCIGGAQSRIVKDFTPVCDSLTTLILERSSVKGELKLKNVMKRGSSLDFYFTSSLSDLPWRESDLRWLRTTLRSLFPVGYSGYKVGEIYTNSLKAEKLAVSGIGFDGKSKKTEYKTENPLGRTTALVTCLDRQTYPDGMAGRHIALWPSHGRYYNLTADKWKWQRPALFTTVEDLLSTGFVLEYLVPMLENSGANVLLPRERDCGNVEIVLDNNPSSSSRNMGSYRETGKWSDAGEGFADVAETYFGNQNPFTCGSARSAKCVRKGEQATASATWTPDIPHRGSYAVYVSYKSLENSTDAALYTVRHMGGTSRFSVNQQIGGGTWIYLGTFVFDKGTEGYVRLENSPAASGKDGKSTVISTDAVKFGGGMGNIARKSKRSGSAPRTSELPRYTEAARYWLQWAGMSPDVYNQHKDENDYRDDLFSRGDWVDFMSGGSYVNPDKKGRGIPIDLTFAFHSDAGVTPNDSTIGTLVIYTYKNMGLTKLPAGENRLTGREFADIVQSQIVNDLRAVSDTAWNRRQIWDRSYRESRTPPSPTILLEGFSHQNFADMRLALDPSFRFTLSRAIYKGMLKYMSNRYGCRYRIQPLPVHSFSVILSDSDKVRLSWMPTTDTIEPTAAPEGYILYTRVDDGAFDTGKKVSVSPGSDGRLTATVEIESGHLYSFKVTAYNSGGESFPSEILSAGTPLNAGESSVKDSTVLIVNNFTRVSSPAWFDSPLYAGFQSDADPGMPYIRDISYVGDMYETRRDKEWVSDDSPGFGASYQTHAGKGRTGNSFDYTSVHGRAMMAAGHPFCSASSEAFCNDSTLYSRQKRYFAADIICGEQVTVPALASGLGERYRVFPTALQNAVRAFTSSGGNILVSGSHIGSDIWESVFPVQTDSTLRAESIDFARKTLGYNHVTGHASAGLSVKASYGFDSNEGEFRINSGDLKEVYRVVSPDAIAPAYNSTCSTLAEYTDTELPCGVGFNSPSGYKAVSFGFPIEALTENKDIENIIRSTLKYFKK